MVGKVLLLVMCGFGLHSSDNLIIWSCNPYFLEFILYTILLVTGALHFSLVMFVFWRCCCPTFTHTSPLRSRVRAFSNHKLSTPALCRRSLFIMSLIAHSVSPCSHHKNHSHEILHLCDFFDSQSCSCLNLHTWCTTPRMLQRELRVLDDHLLPYFNIERGEKGVMAVDARSTILQFDVIYDVRNSPSEGEEEENVHVCYKTSPSHRISLPSTSLSTKSGCRPRPTRSNVPHANVVHLPASSLDEKRQPPTPVNETATICGVGVAAAGSRVPTCPLSVSVKEGSQLNCCWRVAEGQSCYRAKPERLGRRFRIHKCPSALAIANTLLSNTTREVELNVWRSILILIKRSGAEDDLFTAGLENHFVNLRKKLSGW